MGSEGRQADWEALVDGSVCPRVEAGPREGRGWGGWGTFRYVLEHRENAELGQRNPDPG